MHREILCVVSAPSVPPWLTARPVTLKNELALSDRGRRALGLSGGPIHRNARGCHGSGVCAFGCPLDAKLGMHVTYLPEAVAAGARVISGARVDRIIVEGGRAAGVRGWVTEPEYKLVLQPKLPQYASILGLHVSRSSTTWESGIYIRSDR